MSRWTSGLLVGALVGLALLEIPTLGLVAGVLAAAALARTRGLPALAGMLCGTGASALAIMAWSNQLCDASNASGPGYQAGCTVPDLTFQVALAAALLVVGIASTASLYARSRPAPNRPIRVLQK